MWQPRPSLSRLRGGSLLADKALGVLRVSELWDQEVAITGGWVKPGLAGAPNPLFTLRKCERSKQPRGGLKPAAKNNTRRPVFGLSVCIAGQ